ncbi:MAG: hypothetical protein KBC84_01865 [Proteobacteria bacterium]|nr:hypothetical protein [Pseudomonadota bacterium]
MLRLGLFLKENQKFILLVAVYSVFIIASSNLCLAETGGEIFKDAATTLACKVMPGKFGAMLSVFAGIFAIVAAATGSYRGAWALLFVSVGAFIFKEIVKILFNDSIGC